MKKYLYFIKKYAKKYSLPIEICILGIIESGFNKNAISKSGAVGIWQIMSETAKIVGLKSEERVNPDKSTHAAFLHLKNLIRLFNQNWPLTLAAYNGGGAYIKKLVKVNNEKNFWKLCLIKGFKKETKDYVPKFYALLHIIKNHSKYDIKL